MGREEAELREIERAAEDAARTQGSEDEEGVDNFIVFDEENVDFFEDGDDDENDRDDRPPSDAGAFPGEINGVE